jgi:hypothetical protein
VATLHMTLEETRVVGSDSTYLRPLPELVWPRNGLASVMELRKDGLRPRSRYEAKALANCGQAVCLGRIMGSRDEMPELRLHFACSDEQQRAKFSLRVASIWRARESVQ